MRSQTVQYAVSLSLLFAGLMIGFQAGKGTSSDKVILSASTQAMASVAVPPADYFPAQYVNQAKFVEPLPAQF